MSPALSLSVSHLPICKSHDSLPKVTNKENSCSRTALDVKLNRRRLLQNTGLSLVGSGALSARRAEAEGEAPPDASSTRMSYSRFLEYLDQGAVKKVDLFENGTVAVAEIQNPNLNKIQRVKVQLPGLPKELLRKLKEKDVDFAVYPMEINVIASLLDILGNLAFPLILIGSLLLRSSSSNNPGGPNLPFGLGRHVTCIRFETQNNEDIISSNSLCR